MDIADAIIELAVCGEIEIKLTPTKPTRKILAALAAGVLISPP
jgi:hypothetical protein